MSWSFERDNFQRPDANHVAVAHRHAVVLSRCEVGDVNLRSRALREFDVARDKVRVRMRFENRDDLEFLALRGFAVIVHVALGVHHHPFATRTDEIRSMRQAFYKETLVEHSLSFQCLWSALVNERASSGYRGIVSMVCSWSRHVLPTSHKRRKAVSR